MWFGILVVWYIGCLVYWLFVASLVVAFSVCGLALFCFRLNVVFVGSLVMFGGYGGGGLLG